MINKYHKHQLQTNPWHRDKEPHNNHETPDKQSKATSSLFPIEKIAKLEWAQSNAQQNIDQLQNPTMGVCLVDWYDSLRPINNLSVKQGRVFLGWTSTKLG